MKFQIELTVHTNEGASSSEIITLEREGLSDDTLGLSLDEAKSLLTQLQQQMVEQQVAAFTDEVRTCSCGCRHALKGHHTIHYFTLFGELQLASPRFYTCSCQNSDTKSFSPLTHIFE